MTRRSPSVPSFDLDGDDVTFLMATGCGCAVWLPERIEAEQALGRRVNVVATPTAASWLDADQIESLTGWPMRCQQRLPTEPTFRPAGNRVLVSPLSLNTMTKWAHGHADNLVVSLLCEATGLGLDVRAEVSLSVAFAAHSAAGEALAWLRGAGVDVTRVPGTARHPLLDREAPFDPRRMAGQPAQA